MNNENIPKKKKNILWRIITFIIYIIIFIVCVTVSYRFCAKGLNYYQYSKVQESWDAITINNFKDIYNVSNKRFFFNSDYGDSKDEIFTDNPDLNLFETHPIVILRRDNVQIANRYVTINFIIKDGKFEVGAIQFTGNYKNFDNCIEEYHKIKEILVSEYGNPTTDEENSEQGLTTIWMSEESALGLIMEEDSAIFKNVIYITHK